jgi:hypothetical protein
VGLGLTSGGRNIGQLAGDDGRAQAVAVQKAAIPSSGM